MYNILLCKITATGRREKEYIIATAPTAPEAFRKAQFYSNLYQSKGLYHVIDKPSHIVTYCKA